MTAAAQDCWCCGEPQAPGGVVRLGRHPEVALCPRCAYQTATRARDLERSRGRAGWPRARDATVRWVIAHGLERRPIIGAPLRWLGRRLG